MSNLYLGIDVSTQSVSVQVLDIQDSIHIVYEDSIIYTGDNRLQKYGVDKKNKTLPQLPAGEAVQPPLMFLDALDFIFMDMTQHFSDGLTYQISDIVSIGVSAQQHGHVYLNTKGVESFNQLHLNLTDMNEGTKTKLSDIFEKAFSYPHAPIWMFSASQHEAEEIKNEIGSSTRMMQLSGSDSPPRFSGAVIRYIAKYYPSEFRNTARIHLLSSFISGVLAGREDCPIDWGNGAGMSLMNYSKKEWDDVLCNAVCNNLECTGDIKKLLPDLASPTTTIGCMSNYFVEKYGFSADCIVSAGSGDNPQSKVCVDGDVLSLGTSFVLMVNMGVATIEEKKYVPVEDTNAMYDGLGNPFVFGCRTNGALVWDMVRSKLHLDIKEGERVLQDTEIGKGIFLWQPFEESFPSSQAFSPIFLPAFFSEFTPVFAPTFEKEIHRQNNEIENKEDYAAIVDGMLAIMHYYSKRFMSHTDKPLYVTGGPAKSSQIVRRIASFWNRPVVKIGNTGATYGSAISAYVTKHGTFQNRTNTKEIPVQPNPDDVKKAALFEKKLIEVYKKHIKVYQDK